jgi:hypothetical protein
MNTKKRNFLIGFGSILDIMPSRPRRKLSRSVPMTSDQITAKAWEMVGESFRMATGQIDSVLGQTKKRKGV